MSARTLAALAATRDDQPEGADVASAAQALVAAIPTETLAAYTAVVGTVLAAGVGTHYGPFRWCAFAVFVVLAFLAPVAAYHRSVPMATRARPRRVPLPECTSSAFAAAAWGLVMPGSPLGTAIGGNALIFATTSILVGATAALAFGTQVLGKANNQPMSSAAHGGLPGRQDEGKPAGSPR